MSTWFDLMRALGMAAILLACACIHVTEVPEVPSVPDGGVLAIPSHTPLLGPSSARLTMVEFGDFQCPYCGAVQPTVQQVLASYPNDVALAFVNYPLNIHPYALHAAEAFMAADRQGKAWEMHDQMFANQPALTDADLDGYAQAIGLDLVQFDADRSSSEIADEVAQD
jgi:protein-disulfide isomerase